MNKDKFERCVMDVKERTGYKEGGKNKVNPWAVCTKSVGRGASKSNAWIDHVKSYQKAHPSSSWKDCLVKAKATYKK